MGLRASDRPVYRVQLWENWSITRNFVKSLVFRLHVHSQKILLDKFLGTQFSNRFSTCLNQ